MPVSGFRISPKFIVRALTVFTLFVFVPADASADQRRVEAFETLAKDIPGYQRLADHPMAPQNIFTDALGTPLTLSDFKGRVIVLNFWATWCPPCRREMPSLIRLQEAVKDLKIEVVAVSTDRAGVSVVAPYLQRSGLDALEIYLDPRSGLLAAFQSETLPTTVIIDAEGRALGGVFGALEWDRPEVIRALQSLAPRKAGPPSIQKAAMTK